MSAHFGNNKLWLVTRLVSIISMVVAMTVASTGSAVSQSAACNGVTLSGHIKNQAGAALKHYGIVVYPHASPTALHGPDGIAGTISNRHGGYSIRVCFSSRTAGYAKAHSGRLSFDLQAHAHNKKGSWYVRMVTLRPSHASARTAARTLPDTFGVPSKYRKAQGFSPTTRTSARSSVSVVHPPLMYVQAVKHMYADYSLSSSAVENIKAVVALSKSTFGLSGEIAIGGTHEFVSNQRLNPGRHHPRAIQVRPELSVNSVRTCRSYNPYFGSPLGTGECIVENTGTWTGNVTRSREDYVRCSQGNANLLFFNNHNQRSVSMGRGVTFSSKVAVSGMGNSLTVSASYKSGANVTLNFPDSKVKHRFCLGGNGKYVSTSSKLYPTFEPKSSSGGGGCRTGSDNTTPCRRRP